MPKDPVDQWIGQLLFDFENTTKKYRCHYDIMAPVLAISTGLRATDLVRMTWAQVLDKDNTGYIEIDENKKIRFQGTIGYTKQTLPVLSFARTIGRRVFLNMTGNDQKRPFIFGSMRSDFYQRNGKEKKFRGTTMSSKTLRDRIKASIREYDLLGAAPSYDCFRVTWARRMYDGFVDGGMNADYAVLKMMEIMNHKKPQQTRRYLRLDHFTEEDLEMMNLAFPVQDIELNMPTEAFKEDVLAQAVPIDTHIDNDAVRDLGNWRGAMSFG